MNRFMFIAISLVISSNLCWSQDAKMLVEISNDTIMMGNYIQLRYTIENTSGNFEMPELEGLLVISGPNTSSSMSMVNGEVTQKATYSVYLKPVDIGSHSIGPAYINTEDGSLESQPITVTVIDNPDGIQQSPNNFKVLEEVFANGEKPKSKKKKVKRFKI